MRGDYLLANSVRDRHCLETFIRNRDVEIYDIQIVYDHD
jgi:hypothetical protein